MQQEKYAIYGGRQSVIYLSKNSTFHSISKPIGARYHWIHGVLESKQLHVKKLNINGNGSNILIKCQPKEKFENLYVENEIG